MPALALGVLLMLAGAADSPAEPAAEFKAYDLTELSYLPPSLIEKGYKPLPIIQMCEIWDKKHEFGKTPCNVKDWSTPNKKVVQYWAKEYLGEDMVAINIEQNAHETSAGWNFRSKEIENVHEAVRRWKLLVSYWREINPDTKILIYGPMPRVW